MITVVAICLALVSQDPTAEARHRFQVARKHHEAGHFEEAIAEYLLVYELKPIPDVLFNVGQCYRNLGDQKRAIFFFERFVRESGRPQDRARVEALIAELEKELPVETATVAEEKAPELDLTIEDPPPPPPPVIAEEEPVPLEEPSLVEQWWFWTAIGVAAAAAAGGTIAAVTLSHREPEGSLTTIDAR